MTRGTVALAGVRLIVGAEPCLVSPDHIYEGPVLAACRISTPILGQRLSASENAYDKAPGNAVVERKCPIGLASREDSCKGEGSGLAGGASWCDRPRKNKVTASHEHGAEQILSARALDRRLGLAYGRG